MKGTRKLIALVLTLMMVFGIFPAAAFAVESDDAAGDLRYQYTAQESIPVTDENADEWVTVIIELDGATTLDKDEFLKAFRKSSKGFSASKSVAAYRENSAITTPTSSTALPPLCSARTSRPSRPSRAC